MTTKITSLGINFQYPLGINGPFHTLRQYYIETEDGRVDKITELDEPEMPSGVYDLSEETLSSIFDRQVELAEDEW